MGHAATPRKLFQFNLRDTPFCDSDGIQMGDVNHIFLECSKNTGAIDLFYIRSSQKIPFPTTNAINCGLFQSWLSWVRGNNKTINSIQTIYLEILKINIVT